MPKILNWSGKRTVHFNPSKYKIDWNKAPSKGQMEVQKFLKPHWQTHIVLAEFRIPGSLKRIDILNWTNKTAVEFHGGQHVDFIPFFHKTKMDFAAGAIADLEKSEWAAKAGIKWVEVYEGDLNNLKQLFLDYQVIF